MRALFEVVSGDDQNRTLVLRPGETRCLGRGNQADFILRDPEVSRIHCRLEWTQTGVWLLDAGSLTGTWIGDVPVARHRLAPGEVFRLGGTSMQFFLDATDENPTIQWRRDRAVPSSPPAPGEEDGARLRVRSSGRLV
jgi:pSer/pThr/pTyr-binding forkhead associated (FHA) protein